MEKCDYAKNITILKKELVKYSNIVVVGKGPTAKYITKHDPDTFYVGLKQGVMFLKNISIDLFVLTDLSGFYGIEYLVKDIRFILCPFYIHGCREKPDRRYDHKYIVNYTSKLGFVGTLCFVQLYSDLQPIKKLPKFKVCNSGDFCFTILNDVLHGKKITTYGVNKGLGYHPDMINLVNKLPCKDDEQQKWVKKFNWKLKGRLGQMYDPKDNRKITLIVYDKKLRGLKINHL